MIRKIAIVLLFAGLLALANYQDAHAVADDATDHPQVLWPLTLSPQGTANITIQGGNAWGLRKFAQEANRELPGVRVFSGRCADHPWSTCVVVHHNDLGDNGVWAWTTFDDEQQHRDITINTHYQVQDPAIRYAIVCHEFGHVLGMQHHKRHGVDGGWSNEVHLSPSELHALRSAYPSVSR